MTRALIESLLALVAPRCSGCGRAATRYEREPGPDQMTPGNYACDEHVGQGRWSDLPGAATVRAAQAIVAGSPTIGEEAIAMLATLEWAKGGGCVGEDNVATECPVCEEWGPADNWCSGTHKPDCAWLLLMRRAGIRHD